MKTIKFLTLLLMTVGILSCDDDDNSSVMQSVVSETVLDIHAPQEGGQGAPISGEFAKFDFQSGLQPDSVRIKLDSNDDSGQQSLYK